MTCWEEIIVWRRPCICKMCLQVMTKITSLKLRKQWRCWWRPLVYLSLEGLSWGSWTGFALLYSNQPVYFLCHMLWVSKRFPPIVTQKEWALGWGPHSQAKQQWEKSTVWFFFYLLNFFYHSDKSYVGLGEENDKPPHSCWLSWQLLW